MKRQTDKLQIPVEISRLVVAKGLAKPFAIYLYLKFYSSGKVKLDSQLFYEARLFLGIKTKASFNKHFNTLLQLNWIRLSNKSGCYFVRGFDRLRAENSFISRQATTLYFYNLNKLRPFLVGTILSAAVNAQKFFWEVGQKRKLKPVANKRDATSPAAVYANRPKPEYYGLGLESIGKLLGCGRTRASQLRREACKGGFIKTHKRFKEIARLSKPDFEARAYFYEAFPKLIGKIRFKNRVIDGMTVVSVVLQTQDEIVPKIEFKTVTKFNNLSVPTAIRGAISKQALNAQIA